MWLTYPTATPLYSPLSKVREAKPLRVKVAPRPRTENSTLPLTYAKASCSAPKPWRRSAGVHSGVLY